MSTTHDPNITVNVFLDPSPVQEAGFGILLLLVAQATNSLNGDRTMEFTNYDDAVTANDAGYISTSTLAAAAVAFAQRPKPASFKVGRVDLVGGETYATALAFCIADDDDFYGVALDTRTTADILVAAAYIETASKKMLLGLQSSSADWLAGGFPAAFAAASDYERSIVHYHDTGAEWMDVGDLANRLVYDPDDQSAPWNGHSISGVASYAAAPSAAARLNAIANNANLGLPFGGEDFVIDPGVSISGRAIYELLSADWFETRLRERVAAEVVLHANRGEKITIDKAGQATILALIEGLLDQGVAAGHFEPGQTSATGEAISATDRSSRRLRFTARAQLAGSARLFTFNLYFSRDPIAA